MGEGTEGTCALLNDASSNAPTEAAVARAAEGTQIVEGI